MFTKRSLIAVIIFCLFLGCSRRNDDHYNRLGVNYLNNGQHNYAIGALKKAVKLNPSNAEAHFNLGRAYKRGGMDEKARTEFSISTRNILMPIPGCCWLVNTVDLNGTILLCRTWLATWN